MKKLLLILGVLLVVAFIYEVQTLPDVSPLRDENPRITALMRQREEEARSGGKKAKRYQIWIPYSNVSSYLKTAVLIGEDGAFYQHQGYDIEQIKDSLMKNWEKKRFVRGGSTITQQLAKNLFLSTSKNPLRKLREFLIARELEKALSKQRIFTLYLNVIEWGDGVYGVEAASRAYFGKPAKDLTLKEAVLLAACIPNPRRMNPFRRSRSFDRRADTILSRMHRYHHITDAEYQDAVATQVEPRT